MNQVLQRILLLAAIALLSSIVNAEIFDDPRNLKVLPDDVSPAELRDTMRGFSMALAIRCSGCHVGEVESDLSSYDFALDDIEKKRKAREMMRMVTRINTDLQEVFADAKNPPEVSCINCHRGLSKPELIETVLMSQMAIAGVDAAIARYRELYDTYYGGFAYDFSERMLRRLCETLASNGQLDEAFALLSLNLEMYPEASRSYLLRGQILAEQGDKDAARADMLKAQEIEPQSRWIRRQLAILDET